MLQQLHAQEAADESGAWLLARVAWDGQQIRLDRAFDSLPDLVRGQGPPAARAGLGDAAALPAWRPAWASLLPDSLE